MNNKLFVLLALALVATLNPQPAAFAQGTGFTYQGRLDASGVPANGSYDLQFGLWSAASGPTQLGGTLTKAATSVSNGLFTVTLDFGANFPGASRWLEISVRTNGGGAYGTLSPRQAIAATPYAITAGTAASVAIPPGMVLIPAGTFTMGNSIGDGDISDATPISVTVSAFYMDANLVSFSQWQSVFFWATNHGYSFTNAGTGKAANHPVHTVNWYDTVKWCNARSQQVGRAPVYFTDAGLTQIYTNGQVAAIFPNWAATGYRLPTEAEWEKAARGGVNGQRFPWGNVITESLANYYGNTAGYGYDFGPNGYNAAFTNGVLPYTSPVGSFAPNGYGLYDMAANIGEWCWDWYGTPYAGGTDPRGPAPSGSRVGRGGGWNREANICRTALRGIIDPAAANSGLGFRSVLTQIQ